MKQLQSIDELLATRKSITEPLALVPTMGNLHEGHLTLVRYAQSLAPVSMVTIFVNPMQFGPNEDLENYPRTLQNDIDQLLELGVDYIFTPTNFTQKLLANILQMHHRSR